MKEEINTGSYWSFIEEYYPNYDSSDDICESNDFSLWVEGERESELDDKVVELLIKNEVKVFETALRNYIKIKRGYDMKLKKLFIDIAIQHESCEEIMSALRSLESNKEITASDYDYILKNFDKWLDEEGL